MTREDYEFPACFHVLEAHAREYAMTTFADLVFRPHSDGLPLHLHALHRLPNGQSVSVTRGGRNEGTPEAPYEMQGPDGGIYAPLTADGVTELLKQWGF